MKMIVTSKKLSPGLPFVSQAVKSGNLVFVCGMGPDDLNGDIRKQTAETLNTIKVILHEAGASLLDVLKVTVYLSDMNNYDAMNAEYSKFFPNNSPVRTCVQALSPSGSKGQLIEIEAIAAI
jgi:2-iminobutanoate/2-iminopropanoate deaminase